MSAPQAIIAVGGWLFVPSQVWRYADHSTVPSDFGNMWADEREHLVDVFIHKIDRSSNRPALLVRVRMVETGTTFLTRMTLSPFIDDLGRWECQGLRGMGRFERLRQGLWMFRLKPSCSLRTRGVTMVQPVTLANNLNHSASHT